MSLSQELVKELFDYKDGHLYWKVGTRAGQETGCIGSRGYLHTWVKKKSYLTHRIIFLYHFGYLPTIVDHQDGNQLNNKIENLRASDRFTNQYNSRIRSDSKTGVKGVTTCPKTNKYIAKININGTQHYLGIFKTLQEAEQTVKNTREIYHKEFARHE